MNKALATVAGASKKSTRIAAFDLLRGCFLLVVIIDHVELYPSGYDFITGRGQLWVSAAEGFFFLSGLLVGIVNRKKIAIDVPLVFRKLWSRAVLLYVCSVALTLIFTVWAIAYGDPDDIKYAGATHFNWEVVKQTLLLKYVYGWGDFLSYYVTFMLAAPFIMYLFKKKLWWLVAALSLFIWLNRSINFNQAWQVLFFGGMMAGYYWHNIQDFVAGWTQRARDIAWKTVVSAAGVTIVISYLNLFVLDNLHNHYNALKPGFATFVRHWDKINEALWPYFDKFTLRPGRIGMFLLWFTAAFLLMNRYANKLPKIVSWSLNLLGQNSLYVYGMHSFLVFAVHAYVEKTLGLAINFGITTAVLAIMIGITYLKVAYKDSGTPQGQTPVLSARSAAGSAAGGGQA